MTSEQIREVAKRILGEDADLAGLGDKAIKLLVIAKVMGHASTSASDAYVEEAFSKIAGSPVRRDATRLDDPNVDAAPPALDPKTATLEQLRARATKARADAARASEAAYLGTSADTAPGAKPTEQRKDGVESPAEAARRRMVQDAERAWDAPTGGDR